MTSVQDGPAGSAAPRSTVDRLEAFLERAGLGGAPLERLVQDAGERVYYRVRPASGAVVVCVMARPYEPGTLPFTNSTALYRELGVAAPAIRREVPDLGVIELQDLGDRLLQRAALQGDATTPALYREALEILGRIQREGARIGSAPTASRYQAFRMALDAPLFAKELRFFVEHFVEGFAGARPGPAAGAQLERLLAALAVEAASGPAVLCHRDYHARNLMAPPGPREAGGAGGPRLYVIDHQDSRLGPRGYDLMSLARDPYVATRAAEGGWGLPFDEAELAGIFCERVGLRESREALTEEFDTVALQRNLKALGTYGYQAGRRRNPVYRRFVAPTLAFVRENLDRRHGRRERRELFTLLGDLVGFA